MFFYDFSYDKNFIFAKETLVFCRIFGLLPGASIFISVSSLLAPRPVLQYLEDLVTLSKVLYLFIIVL